MNIKTWGHFSENAHSSVEVERNIYGFVVGLLKTLRKCGYICVIVDRLIKSDHSIMVRVDYHETTLVKIYVKVIVSLH